MTPLVFVLAFPLALFVIPVAAAAQESQAVVAPIDNRAELTADEIAVVTGAVRSALASGAGELEIVPAEPSPGAACDGACAAARAQEIGALYLITGSVSRFGGQITLQIEALDRTSGAIAASSSTPPIPALVDLLPLIGPAAADLRAALVAKLAAKPAAAAPAATAKSRAEWGGVPAALPAPRPSTPDDSTVQIGDTGVLVVTTDPPGASVFLGHTKHYAGVTPLVKHLPPEGTRVSVYLDGYYEIAKKPVRIFSGETKKLHFVLRKKSAAVTGGSAMLCFGTASAIAGGIMIGSYNENPERETSINRAGTVVLSLGGALAVTGAIMLIVHAVRSPNKKSARSGLTMAPSPDGVAMTYLGTF